MIDANYAKDIIIALYVEQNQRNEIEKASTAILFSRMGLLNFNYWTAVLPCLVVVEICLLVRH